MKPLSLFISILIILLIQSTITANAYPTGTSADLPNGIPSSELQQVITDKLRQTLSQQQQQSEEQHSKDLLIIAILIAVSIAVTCVVVALSIVFLKNRRSLNKGIS